MIINIVSYFVLYLRVANQTKAEVFLHAYDTVESNLKTNYVDIRNIFVLILF